VCISRGHPTHTETDQLDLLIPYSPTPIPNDLVQQSLLWVFVFWLGVGEGDTNGKIIAKNNTVHFKKRNFLGSIFRRQIKSPLELTS